jgi:hypothetical protein
MQPMNVADLVAVYGRAEASLNCALADYEASSNAETREFFLLKVQLLIFYYDVQTGMLNVGRNNPKGFAQAVALKTLYHSLYEYEKRMRETLVPRIQRYAASRKKPIDTALEAEEKKWRAQLARIRGWKKLRNMATGHYGKDIELQIELLKKLSQKEVLPVARAFVDYTHNILLLTSSRKRGAA